MNNKKTIIILILVLTIGIVGLTVAYFSNSTTLNNIFETKSYGDVFTEEFVAPTNWLPGDTTNKSVVATNTGEVDQAVRVKLTESWKTANNGTLNGWIHADGTKSKHTSSEDLENDQRVAVINFDNLSDWTKVGDYYYYKYKLSPNEETSSLIKSVTFNPNTKLDNTCVSTQTATGQTITCNSSGSDYDHATYTLTFDIETVQYNKYNEAWNLNNAVAISEEKQRMLKGLKVNVTDATFDTGDKTAMFEFSHPATEQTPALTDYRYIGHMPNNYVKFNCDNDGTNCEIWRIIGVFDVDDGNGNYEQRIKLVRGSALPETMQWDDDSDNVYSNNWPTSSLTVFLNNDYLTKKGDALNYGLKELAQSQIEDAKYYLGGTEDNNGYGTADEIYLWERGNNVFNHDNFCLGAPYDISCTEENYCENNPTEKKCYTTNSISWVGKIAIMYPSDYVYIYSNGVDNNCYSDSSKCTPTYENYVPGQGLVTLDRKKPGYPQTNWIYNSNNLEGQNHIEASLFISPGLYHIYEAFGLSPFGDIGKDGHLSDGGGVRPVLYLKPSIQITGGDGTEQNPYTLSNQ